MGKPTHTSAIIQKGCSCGVIFYTDDPKEKCFTCQHKERKPMEPYNAEQLEDMATRLKLEDPVITNERLNGDNADLVMACAIYEHTAKRFKSGNKLARTHGAFQDQRTLQVIAENTYKMRQRERDGGSASNPRKPLDIEV